ncbi:hypothetical protein EC844_11476 [Acinetobacter calcoaceticus]|uniref:Uncharacterized protein n=1 Tax=Acinetobacter calcoaceticus TaxID=471 RepID=A0A4R1XTU4_ACICA|nr:hypothetical protein EC844_11476 [Acinetobacter calcoaceticus]
MLCMQKNKTQSLFLILSSLVISLGASNRAYADATSSSRLSAMSDEQLAQTTGQALLNLTYTAPRDAVNLETRRSGGDKNMGFYKVGLEADLELNTNVRKLQLGCGGVNGPGCDIDIDYLSLSGVASSSNGRAGSSAVLNNPFLEFAVKNPQSAATREVAGLRFSAEAIQGLLTFGLDNGVTKNGINTLSGYMEVAATGGQVRVNPIYDLSYKDTDTMVTGNAQGWFVQIPFSSDDYKMNIVPTRPGALKLPQQVISGHRINRAPLKAWAVVSNIDLGGTIKASTLGLVLDKKLAGQINNLVVDVTIDENLGFFHKANLNGSAAYLSSQSQSIQWPGAKSVANRGWWLELSNPIDIGDVTPEKAVDIAMPTLRETLGQVSAYLKKNPVQCGGFLLSCIAGDTIDTGKVNLINSTPVNMNLKDLQLKNQSFMPNCYGGMKFC